jgi:hypothetical protein
MTIGAMLSNSQYRQGAHHKPHQEGTDSDDPEHALNACRRNLTDRPQRNSQDDARDD